ncbi:MAG: bifunctional riboflavin kinase/FAD synthetase [Butyrivibrio sp.]
MIFFRDKFFNIDRKTVVTFGKFDGIHKGHRKLFAAAREIADREGLLLAAFAFKVAGGCSFGYMEKEQITTFEEREEIFEELGADIIVEYPFDEEVARTEPLAFLEQIIKNRLNAAYVVVGSDWQFGKDRAGNTDMLKAAQKLYNFNAVVLDKELYQGKEISSSWIREEIRNGNMENVNILLDYPYTIKGTVEHGNHIGTSMGFPTVNIVPGENKLLPPRGVYASKVLIDNKMYYGVTNIGVKPTVSSEERLTIETFILNFEGDIYREDLKVQLFHFQRPEMKFSDRGNLANQIKQDVDFTKSYFMI